MLRFDAGETGNWVARTSRGLALGALVVGLALSGSAQTRGAQQDQSQSDQTQAQQDQQQQPPGDQPPPQAQPTDRQQAPPTGARPKPKYASQDADKPPYASDPSPDGSAQRTPRAHAPSPEQYDPDKDLPPQDQNTPEPNDDVQGPAANPNPPYRNDGPYRNGSDQGAPPRGPRASAPVQPPPASLTIPAGTVLRVRVNEYLSSDRNQVGDRVTATLESPIVVNGYVVARRGQTLTGQVDAAQKAGRVKGTSQLGIELTDLTVVDGQQRPILTELWKGSGGTTHGQDAATIGGTTALGAAIGAAADWGRGAAIGAGAGAAAGIGAVLLTRGRPTVIAPETPLSFRLVQPVTVDTTQSQRAFLPAGQQDYDGGRGDRRRPHLAGGYPSDNDCANDGPDGPCYVSPGYAYPAYGYPAYGYYPGYYYPYVGFGWGPGFYGRGFHGGRGFRR